MTRRCLVLVAALFVAGFAGAFAEDFPPPGVAFNASLSSNSVRAGEAVSITVTMQKSDDNLGVCSASFFIRPDWGCDIKISLASEGEKSPIKERVWPVWPFRQHFSNWISSEGGAFDIPISMRCSTELTAGKYLVTCSVPSVVIRRRKTDGTVLSELKGTVSLPPLNLEITNAEARASAEFYGELLKTALKAQSLYDAAHAGSLGDWMDYVPELRRLMWAWGPAAVPVQLRAIHDGRYFPYNSSLTIFAYQNILEHPSRDAVEKLVSLAKDVSFVQTECWSGSFDPNLVWVLDEIRKRGDPQYVPLVESTLARFKTPIDLHLLEMPN